MHKKFWTDEYIQWVRENAYGVSNKELTRMFNECFGLNVNEISIKNVKKTNKITSGIRGFNKGNIPWNKGVPMKPEVYEKVKRTFFKKGEVSTRTRPIGSQRVSRDGYVEVKINPKKWALKHILVWEEHNGPVPDGMIITFKDNNSQNCNIENLMLISRRENALINRLNINYKGDKEISVLTARLYDAIKDRRKENG